jgi:curved DNA-binding protein CbpA
VSDYYNVLRLGHNASKKEIEKAHERLLKEAYYDSTIDKQAVETAYRILIDVPSKARYDAHHTTKTRKIVAGKRKFKFNIQEILEWFTLPRLLMILVISLLVTIGFYWFRYGYVLQTFQAGDVLMDRATHKRYGRVLKVESEHLFGNDTEPGYQVQLDTSQFIIGSNDRVIWLTQNTVKARCTKP